MSGNRRLQSICCCAEGSRPERLPDADIYGPSVPIMMGATGERPTLISENTIRPLNRYGIDLISMGNLIEDTDAVVAWPYAHKSPAPIRG